MDNLRDTRRSQRSPYLHGEGCIGGPDVLGELATYAQHYEDEPEFIMHDKRLEGTLEYRMNHGEELVSKDTNQR